MDAYRNFLQSRSSSRFRCTVKGTCPASLNLRSDGRGSFGSGGKGIRTPGLLIANETLYQLSYTPILPMKNGSRQNRPKISFVHRFCTPVYYCMDKIQPKHGVLQKVGESLYRYSSNRVYYARIKKDGKEIKRSLGTTDPALARRNLAALKDELRQTDRSQGRISLEELADRYLRTIQHQKPKTVERKTFIVGRIKRPLADWQADSGRENQTKRC